MTKMILVRHGETLWNKERRIQGCGSDVELSELGKAQAESVGLRLKEERLGAVYSSPLKRALETARAIARFHSLEVKVVPDLRELDAGSLEGIPLASLISDFDQFLLDWQHGDGTARIPEGESLLELSERSWTAVNRILEKNHEGTVVIVSHYFVSLAIILRALEMPLSQMRQLRMKVGSLSILDFEGQRARLVALNDTCHLETKA